jgi:predicted phage tail protein
VNDVPRFDKIVIWLAVALALLMLFCGCGQTSTDRSGHKTTKRVVRETPLANGGKLTEESIVTDDASSELVTSKADDSTQALINGLSPIAGAAIGAATGTTGFPWAEVISIGATAAAGGVAAMKHGQAKAAQARADIHKEDSDEAWAKLEARGQV